MKIFELLGNKLAMHLKRVFSLSEILLGTSTIGAFATSYTLTR